MNTLNPVHTSGPWAIDAVPGASRFEVTADNRRTIIAETISKGGVEARMNAMLMAAAPDMLEVCRDLVRVLSACVDSNGAWSDFNAAVKRCLLESAKAAVEKAVTIKRL